MPTSRSPRVSPEHLTAPILTPGLSFPGIGPPQSSLSLGGRRNSLAPAGPLAKFPRNRAEQQVRYPLAIV